MLEKDDIVVANDSYFMKHSGKQFLTKGWQYIIEEVESTYVVVLDDIGITHNLTLGKYFTTE